MLLASALGAGPTPPTGSVAVYVDGVRGSEGAVVVRVYRSATGFPDDRRLATRELQARIGGGGATVILNDIPTGRIAVAVFHDADGDGRLRRTADGHPLDGVSATGWDGSDRPRFGRSAVTVATDGIALVRLRLRYPGPVQS